MAERFEGIEAALSYTGEGLRENSCLAVNLSITGAGTIEEADAALIKAGITDTNGVSTIPPQGVSVEVEENTVTLGPAKPWFGADQALADAATQFEKSEGVILGVQLNEEDPDDGDLHYILLAGQFYEDEEATDILVGDSLHKDTQAVDPAVLKDRLERTIEWTHALMSWHVKVG